MDMQKTIAALAILCATIIAISFAFVYAAINTITDNWPDMERN